MNELLYSPKITPEHLARKAIVYLRQSSEKQVRQNTESHGFNTTWPSESRSGLARSRSHQQRSRQQCSHWLALPGRI